MMTLRLHPHLGSLAALALLATAAACARDEPVVWLVHATDPHLFTEPETQPADEAVRTFQENLNRQAFTALLESLDKIPETAGQRPLLVVSGDFGIGEPAPPAAADTREADTGNPAGEPPTDEASGSPGTAPTEEREEDGRIRALAEVLGTVQKRQILFVPGNNDVEEEAAGPDPLRKAHELLGRVQERLDASKTGVVLSDLTTCYESEVAPLTGCFADVRGTRFRLIGFPTSSFKTSSKKPDRTAEAAIHKAWMTRLRQLLDQAESGAKSVLLITHVPELDDPYIRAQEEFAGVKRYDPAHTARPSPWSAWDVDAEVFAGWKQAVESPIVAGVLAGHFHDSHRELYRPPYPWSSNPAGRADPAKTWVAPPLAVRLQDGSPLQARGFALLGLGKDRVVERRLYWFDPQSKRFLPENEPAPGATERPAQTTGQGARNGLATFIRSLWRLPPAEVPPLQRAAVIAIALLAAFLTVVEVWQIPPPSEAASGGNEVATNAAAPAPATPLSAFKTNFSRTVVSGFGGLVAVQFLATFWKVNEAETQGYYLVLFVTFFISLLVVSALIRAVTEAIRSRIAAEHGPAAWRQRPANGTPVGQLVDYFVRRFLLWIISWRSALLILFDTFFNFLQGKNQSRTALLGDYIVDLHWSLIRTAQRVRQRIDDALYDALNSPEAQEILGSKLVDHKDFRVNLSVLSRDESSLFYIVWSKGSVYREFGKNSVAWASVFAGDARWWKGSCHGEKGDLWDPIYGDADLFTNENGEFPVADEVLTMKKYFQGRYRDYRAFVVLPIPWAGRGDSTYHRAGIHISFDKPEYLDALWGKHLEVRDAEDRPTKPNYAQSDKLLTEEWLNHAGLREVLSLSVAVLAESLRHFNQTVFETRIRPYLAP